MPQFDAFFADYLERVLGVAPPALGDWTGMDLRHLNPAAEKALRAESEQLVRTMRPDIPGSESLHISDRFARLRASYADIGLCIEEPRLREITNRYLAVEPMSPANLRADRDFVFVKINHGFWEQFLAIYAEEIDPAYIRVQARKGYADRHIRSGFALSVQHLFEHFANRDGDDITFDDIQLAVSLGGGSMPYSKILSNYAHQDARIKTVTSGAALGLTGFLDTLFGPRRVRFLDGGFPKLGLQTGALARVLDFFSSHSGKTVFVVPPHLKGIALKARDRNEQDAFYVSGTKLQESWIPYLYLATKHVLDLLDRHDAVTVVTQSAVFAATFGGFLKTAKDAFHGPARRLYFLDLGQVLDIANPEQAGFWANRAPERQNTLFEIMPQ